MQMKPGGVQELPLLHHHAKIFAQRGDLYSACTIGAVCKGVWKTAHARAAPGNLHPFPRALMTCLPPDP